MVVIYWVQIIPFQAVDFLIDEGPYVRVLVYVISSL